MNCFIDFTNRRAGACTELLCLDSLFNLVSKLCYFPSLFILLYRLSSSVSLSSSWLTTRPIRKTRTQIPNTSIPTVDECILGFITDFIHFSGINIYNSGFQRGISFTYVRLEYQVLPYGTTTYSLADAAWWGFRVAMNCSARWHTHSTSNENERDIRFFLLHICLLFS